MAKRTTARRTRGKTRTRRDKRNGRRWSRKVTEESTALDLDEGIFGLSDPKKIAASLKRSAERSKRRKAEPFRSAMSMLTFYINRGGKNLSAARKKPSTKPKKRSGSSSAAREAGTHSAREQVPKPLKASICWYYYTNLLSY